MGMYVDDGTDQELLTPEVTAAPIEITELARYVESYLQQIREDLLKMMSGSWRVVEDGNNFSVQQYSHSSQTWIERLSVEGKTTMAFEDGTEMIFEDGTEAKFE